MSLHFVKRMEGVLYVKFHFYISHGGERSLFINENRFSWFDLILRTIRFPKKCLEGTIRPPHPVATGLLPCILNLIYMCQTSLLHEIHFKYMRHNSSLNNLLNEKDRDVQGDIYPPSWSNQKNIFKCCWDINFWLVYIFLYYKFNDAYQ